MYHVDKKNGDLVFDGYEQGIADAPEQGIAMLRNINLVSIPGEASVNFGTTAVNIPPAVTAAPCTFSLVADTVTWTPTATLYNGVTVTFDATTGGVTAGTVYWVGSVSGSTFKIYTTPGRDVTTLVDLTANSTPNFSTITFGKPTYKTLDQIGTPTSRNNIFILDANGRVWWVNLSLQMVHLGNSTLTSTHGNGICAFGNFLYVFRDTAIDYIPIDAVTNTSATSIQWVYGWQTTTSPPASSGYSHYAMVAATNGAMHFCNDRFIGRVLPTGGPLVDPTNGATFIVTLLAPSSGMAAGDSSTCLAELGGNILVGGILNRVYQWDGLSSFFSFPLIIAENYTTRMVTTNSSTYIFAGNRGRIYITNGSNVNLFKKIPDQITNGTDPYFTWLDAVYWKNQIYFSFLAATNANVSITTLGGLWAVDVSMNIMGTATAVALRMTNTLVNGVGAYPYVIAPNIISANPAGAGLYLPWVNGSTYGVDVSTTAPYSDYSAPTVTPAGEVYTDLVPTGTLFAPRTFTQIEWKLATELVAGEAVRVSYRQSYSQGWTVVGSTTYSANTLSDIYTVDFQSGQWLQLYVELQSTASSPSYVRLKEVRVR